MGKRSASLIEGEALVGQIGCLFHDIDIMTEGFIKPHDLGHFGVEPVLGSESVSSLAIDISALAMSKPFPEQTHKGRFKFVGAAFTVELVLPDLGHEGVKVLKSGKNGDIPCADVLFQKTLNVDDIFGDPLPFYTPYNFLGTTPTEDRGTCH